VRKSRLARRLIPILPAMTLAEAIEPRVSIVSPHPPVARPPSKACLAPPHLGLSIPGAMSSGITQNTW
jgi:hypothetical protein